MKFLRSLLRRHLKGKTSGGKSFRRAVVPLLLAVYNTVVFKLAPGLFSPIF